MNKLIIILVFSILENYSIASESSKRFVTFSEYKNYDENLGNRRLKHLIKNRIKDLSTELSLDSLESETCLNIIRFMKMNGYSFYEEIHFPPVFFYRPIVAKSDFIRLVKREVDKIEESLHVVSYDSNPEKIGSEVVIADIDDPSTSQGYSDTDVLCGRGGKAIHHSGNKKFRVIVKNFHPEYTAKSRDKKREVAQKIVDIISDNKGRFLRITNKKWEEVDNDIAVDKTMQALREHNSIHQS